MKRRSSAQDQYNWRAGASQPISRIWTDVDYARPCAAERKLDHARTYTVYTMRVYCSYWPYICMYIHVFPTSFRGRVKNPTKEQRNRNPGLYSRKYVYTYIIYYTFTYKKHTALALVLYGPPAPTCTS